jgi:hypothetical protein
VAMGCMLGCMVVGRVLSGVGVGCTLVGLAMALGCTIRNVAVGRVFSGVGVGCAFDDVPLGAGLMGTVRCLQTGRGCCLLSVIKVMAQSCWDRQGTCLSSFFFLDAV